MEQETGDKRIKWRKRPVWIYYSGHGPVQNNYDDQRV